MILRLRLENDRDEPADPERQQQPPVVVRRHIQQPQHGAIAGRLARQQILAGRQNRKGMEEEPAFSERRHASQPEIAATEMHQLVTDRHPLLGEGQRIEETGRQQDHRTKETRNHRCVNVARPACSDAAAHARTKTQLAHRTLNLRIDRVRARDGARGPADAIEHHAEPGEGAGDPERCGDGAPRAAGWLVGLESDSIPCLVRLKSDTTAARLKSRRAAVFDWQDAKDNWLDPDECDNQLERREPPERAPRGGGNSRGESTERSRREDHHAAGDRCREEDLKQPLERRGDVGDDWHHRGSFFFAVCSRATTSSSSLSSASVSAADSLR